MRKKDKLLEKDGFNLGHEPEVVNLMKWLKLKDWTPCYRMRVAKFQSTDRGLQVLEHVKEGSVIVSIPIEACVTRYYLSTSWVGEILAEHFEKFSTQVLLSFWLAIEKDKFVKPHLVKNLNPQLETDKDLNPLLEKDADLKPYPGLDDHWKPYINYLPNEYSLPLYYNQTELSALPGYISSHVYNQENIIQQSYLLLKGLFACCRYTWGYSTVNTRAVYLEKDPRDSGKGERGENTLALVPFLDLLNHSDDVSVEAGINIKQSRDGGGYYYEIKVDQDTSKFSELFICYGKHSNTKLLTEYGFHLGKGNQNEHIKVELEELINFLKLRYNISNIKAKLDLLEKAGLVSNLGISEGHLPWNLQAVIYILMMDPSKINEWHKVYLQDLFQPLHSVILSFLQFILQYVNSCLVNMMAVQCPSKYFSYAISLVQFHVQMLKSCINVYT
ncbi:SET domain-containing protein 4 isoform X2 [Eurytemora carolleeae]|uniref:SET domain-containing protein 4 isoform X2 n=1 Tax=Eurytemora carolleeae TaxID=1294199 RepID=UPI000C76DF48|nr:SET domain-containing protein 4 isoform X2 [Eurytemora carolleeae]|eukprot:XP_023320525.1 SET domain-containing protein 4-like isoform X2 [Eurytemora affinis]